MSTDEPLDVKPKILEVTDDEECPVCTNSMNPVQILKCGHKTCQNCASRLEECPICRKVNEVHGEEEEEEVKADESSFPEEFACAKCSVKFLLEEMRYCLTCSGIDEATTTEATEHNKPLEHCYCNTCAFCHVDEGHKTVAVASYEPNICEDLAIRKKATHLQEDYGSFGDNVTVLSKTVNAVHTILTAISEKHLKVPKGKSEAVGEILDKITKSFGEQKEVIVSHEKQSEEHISDLKRLVGVDDIKSLPQARNSFAKSPALGTSEEMSTEIYRVTKLGDVEHLWNHTGDKDDALAFTVSDPVCLSAIGVFGSKKEAVFTAKLTVWERRGAGLKKVVQYEEKVNSNGHTLMHTIPLPEPIRLKPSVQYHISYLATTADDRNNRSFHAANSDTKIIRDVGGKFVQVNFLESKLSKNGTDERSGDLPSIFLIPIQGSLSRTTRRGVNGVDKQSSATGTPEEKETGSTKDLLDYSSDKEKKKKKKKKESERPSSSSSSDSDDEKKFKKFLASKALHDMGGAKEQCAHQ